MAVVWIGTLNAIHAQRDDASARVVASVVSQANSFQDQIHRQVLDLDQTLRILGSMWAADPAKFDLTTWRDRAVSLSGISRDLLLADSHGIVVQSTVPDTVGTDVGSREFFAYARQHGNVEKGDYLSVPDEVDAAYIGPAISDQILHPWHMEVARSLRQADGTFGGALVANWRVSAIDALFSATDLGLHPLMALVGLSDGKLRSIAGRTVGTRGKASPILRCSPCSGHRRTASGPAVPPCAALCGYTLSAGSPGPTSPWWSASTRTKPWRHRKPGRARPCCSRAASRC